MTCMMRLVAFAFALMLSLPVHAAALIDSLSGTVRAGASAATATAASRNQRVLPGTVVTTGPKSQAVLRFDDGQAIALAENTEFRVTAYSFAREAPAKDSFVFELLRGALRSVTGLVSQRNPQGYALRIPQATIGIRGTDFMVAVVNPAFLSVLNGAIAATNSAGSATFGAGATGTIASSTALATAIPASALPASVAASFSQLGSLVIAAGAGAATEAAAGGITPGVVAAGVAALAGIVAAASDDGATGTSGTATTGSAP